MTMRALRNNNPGNINAGDHWQGLMPRASMTGDQSAEERFAVFESPKWGFRAMAIILLNYQRIHHLRSIRQFIQKWAPYSENDTDAYIADVCRECGRGPDEVFDLTIPSNLEKLLRAIARHESGLWLFNDADLSAGVALAETTARTSKGVEA
jgi:hypothetical protein